MAKRNKSNAIQTVSVLVTIGLAYLMWKRQSGSSQSGGGSTPAMFGGGGGGSTNKTTIKYGSDAISKWGVDGKITVHDYT